jgi:hypothetical protein
MAVGPLLTFDKILHSFDRGPSCKTALCFLCLGVEYEHHLKTKSAPKCAIRDPAGTRTQDPYIKSVLLYQLSYGIIPRNREHLSFLGVQK